MMANYHLVWRLLVDQSYDSKTCANGTWDVLAGVSCDAWEEAADWDRSGVEVGLS